MEYRVFTGNGVLALTAPALMDILMVGGGGGGGYEWGGGGGGGGVLHANNCTIPAGNYTIVVGDGGSGGIYQQRLGSSGRATQAFGATAQGGGGAYGAVPGDVDTSSSTGGCGGGGSALGAQFPDTEFMFNPGLGASVILNTFFGSFLATGMVSSYGNSGGTGSGVLDSSSVDLFSGGGGGGAGQQGVSTDVLPRNSGGHGGDGQVVDIIVSGSPPYTYYWAGGGGGAVILFHQEMAGVVVGAQGVARVAGLAMLSDTARVTMLALVWHQLRAPMVCMLGPIRAQGGGVDVRYQQRPAVVMAVQASSSSDTFHLCALPALHAVRASSFQQSARWPQTGCAALALQAVYATAATSFAVP